MVVAEISIFPLGTGSPGVSGYVRAAVEELEASGLKCTLGPMGTTVEAKTAEEVYAALARAQAAVFELGAGRAYTVVKMDDRRDVEEGRSAEEMVRSIRGGGRTLPSPPIEPPKKGTRPFGGRGGSEGAIYGAAAHPVAERESRETR